MELFHPEAVEVERSQRDPPFEHAVDKAHDRLLVIVCRERGGQPQSESPRRGESRLSGDVGVSSQHVFHLRPVDQEVVKVSALHGELSLCDHLCADLELDVFRMVYKDTIPFA